MTDIAHLTDRALLQVHLFTQMAKRKCPDPGNIEKASLVSEEVRNRGYSTLLSDVQKRLQP